MYTIRFKKFKILRSNVLSYNLRVFCYKNYKINLGFLQNNFLFINFNKILNFIFLGFRLKTLKLSKNLKFLCLKLILSVSLLKLIQSTSYTFVPNIIKKKIRKNFLNNFFKLLEKDTKSLHLVSLNYYFSKRWF